MIWAGMRRRPWLSAAAVAALVVGGLTAAGLRLEPFVVSGFDREAAVTAARSYDAVIRRDAWGVPRVWGRRDADAAFALGYAVAEDQFALVQDAVNLGRGDRAIAESRQEAQVAYLAQLFRVRDYAERDWDTVDAKTRALLDGYAAGLNLYAARHPDAITRPGLFPVTGRDLAAAALFTEPLFYGMSGVLARLVAPNAKRVAGQGQGLQLGGSMPGVIVRGDMMPMRGSNGFAVAPRRSADGATRLIVNSHQPLEGPLAWVEASMRSDEGLNFSGGTFPGAPFLYVGANPDLAWTATTNRPDLIDTYKLVTDGERYRLDGQWRDFDARTAAMTVRLWGPFLWRVTRPAKWSAHGPVLDTPDGAVAIRYASMGNLKGVSAYYRLMRARSVGEAQAVLDQQGMANQNRLFADRAGRIARFYVARMPARKEGVDWQGMVPGDRSDLIWRGFAPQAAMPNVIDPPEGFVVEANSAPWKLMLGPSDPDPAKYSRTFGIENESTNRGFRAPLLFSGDRAISREAMLRYKFDDAYDPRAFVGTLRAQLLAAPWAREAKYARAVALVRDWNLRADTGNRAAALSLLTFQPIGTAVHLGQTPPDLRDSFDAAIAFLTRHYGRLDVPWGTVNRLERGDASLPLGGGPDTLRAANSEKDDARGTLRTVSGDGLVMLVEWAGGVQRVESVSPFGSSTDPKSRHYTDQMGLFVTERFKGVPMSAAEDAAVASAMYRPGAERR